MDRTVETFKKNMNYYLKLENELVENNFCNSEERLIEIYLSIGSLVDSLAQDIVYKTDKSIKNSKTITTWGYYIEKYYPGILTFTVRVNNNDFYPYNKWQNEIKINDFELCPFPNWYHKEVKKSVNGKIKTYKYLEKDCVNPKWWKNYNDVKHNRNKKSSKCCVTNILLAMSAFYAFSLVYMSLCDIDASQYHSNLFKVDYDHFKPKQ